MCLFQMYFFDYCQSTQCVTSVPRGFAMSFESKKFQGSVQAYYEQLSTRFDMEHGIIWLYMHAAPRPCFTPRLLDDLRKYQRILENHGGRFPANGELLPVNYQVLTSDVPGVYNLGGDLNLFMSLIRERDRAGLLKYATACIDVLFPNAINYNLPLTTISLVKGQALGGGFEAALSSNVVIAERGSQMGLPEILFNLFPGMGAYSLLARRIDPIRAEQLILGGRIHTAEELFEMGVVDILAEEGEGEEAVYRYVRKHSRSRIGQLAMQRVRQRYNPVTHAELMDITRIWVDAAMQLEAKDLKVMERLVRAQDKAFSEEKKGENAHEVA